MASLKLSVLGHFTDVTESRYGWCKASVKSRRVQNHDLLVTVRLHLHLLFTLVFLVPKYVILVYSICQSGIHKSTLDLVNPPK